MASASYGMMAVGGSARVDGEDAAARLDEAADTTASLVFKGRDSHKQVSARRATQTDVCLRRCPKEPLLRVLLLLCCMLACLLVPLAVTIALDGDDAQTPAHGEPRPSPRRLRITGRNVSSPEGEPIILRGFNFMWRLGVDGMEHVTRQDQLVGRLLPRTALLRLIVNHWDDDVTDGDDDCLDAAAPDFLNARCVTLLDEVLNWSTRELPHAWSIVTARSALAAGDGDATVFNNATLRHQWLAMWAAIARRYAAYDNVAGYEVMSEPRTFAAPEVVAATQQAACDAIWEADAAAACVVGAPRFYNRFHLNASLRLRGGPVIYAANLFAPRTWVLQKGPWANTTHVAATAAVTAAAEAAAEAKAAAAVAAEAAEAEVVAAEAANVSSGVVSTGANFSAFVSRVDSVYGGLFACCDAYQKDAERRASVCGGGDAAACAAAPAVRVDKAFLRGQLRDVVRFRDEVDAPCWIDQWGVMAAAAGGARVIERYLDDVIALFDEMKLHWTLWIWRRVYRPEWDCGGHAVVCQLSGGAYEINEHLLNSLAPILS